MSNETADMKEVLHKDGLKKNYGKNIKKKFQTLHKNNFKKF